MLKIGELSKLTNTPIKTIRFYEEEGLMSPVEVDRWTGYRYYDDTSINRLSEIAYLKDFGFTLKEIREMSNETIAKKLKELKVKLEKIKDSINVLSSFEKGGIIMKNFVNEPKVVGKWQRIGIVNSEENFKKGIFEENADEIFPFKELYFLPNGEEYWVLSWSKGKLFVNDRAFDYKIIDGKMLVFVKDRYTDKVDNIAVYSQIDNKEYTRNEIRIQDNTDLPFIMDERVIGAWEIYDYIHDPKTFNPKTIQFDPAKQWQKLLVFTGDGKYSMTDTDGDVKVYNWTKDGLINKERGTVSAYKIVDLGKDRYLISEWKSGDYVYGGKIFGYYVYKKIK